MTNALDEVRAVVIQALELQVSPEALQGNTLLFGSLPELDSFGVVALVAALEDHFDIAIDDDEFGADLFETVASLTKFVERKRAQVS